ncbi:MAG: cupin domain-containing protein [Lachnospiraceae bacterium]|nr:cupin domain-containing protein [Lachnospiraceae bacterium]
MNGAFSVAKIHKPKEGLTVSTSAGITSETRITWFSLGAGTDISAETYDTPVIYIGMGGNGRFVTSNKNTGKKVGVSNVSNEVSNEETGNILGTGDVLIIQPGTLSGTETEDGFVYGEIMPMEAINMNNLVKPGEVFNLVGLLPYEDGSIVNMDVASNDAMKFVLMSFDQGTGLSAHRAPGDALVFALEGKAIIGYEGQDYPIEAGQTFRFEKNGLHSVTADGKFKMALLLTLK